MQIYGWNRIQPLIDITKGANITQKICRVHKLSSMFLKTSYQESERQKWQKINEAARTRLSNVVLRKCEMCSDGSD